MGSVCGGGAGWALTCSSAAARDRICRVWHLGARTAARGAAATSGSGWRTRAAAARPPPLCCSDGSSRLWLRGKAWAAPKGWSLPHPSVRSTHRPKRSRTKPSGGASSLHHRRRPGRRGGVGGQTSSARGEATPFKALGASRGSRRCCPAPWIRPKWPPSPYRLGSIASWGSLPRSPGSRVAQSLSD